jgi:hypothetical protein
VTARARDRLPLLLGLCAIAFPYVLGSWRMGWIADPWLTVYGGPVASVPTLRQALTAASGGVSPYRLLSPAFTGFLGGWLGPGLTHLFQALLHVACALLLYRLLVRLRWPARDAALAMALFGAAPWIAQAVAWWGGVHSIVSTLWLLLAAHAWLSWRQRRSWWALTSAWACAFLGLLFYELWLAGFLVFWALELHLALRGAPAVGRAAPRLLAATLLRAAPMLLPWVAWGAWLLAAPNALGYHPHVSSASRLAWLFVSIQARALRWFQGPWKQALVDGLSALGEPLGAALAAAAVALGVLAWRARDRLGSEATPRPSLVAGVLLGWFVLMGGRLAFVLLGGMATYGRHDYGAAMGAAIAGATLAARLNAHAAAAALATLLSIASAGSARHYRATAAAERATFERLAPLVGQMPEGTTVVILGEPDRRIRIGELSYFAGEREGYYLEELLKTRAPRIRCYVVPEEYRVDAHAVHLRVWDTDTWHRVPIDLPRDRVALFAWEAGQLAENPDHP